MPEKLRLKTREVTVKSFATFMFLLALVDFNWKMASFYAHKSSELSRPQTVWEAPRGGSISLAEPFGIHPSFMVLHIILSDVLAQPGQRASH